MTTPKGPRHRQLNVKHKLLQRDRTSNKLGQPAQIAKEGRAESYAVAEPTFQMPTLRAMKPSIEMPSLVGGASLVTAPSEARSPRLWRQRDFVLP